MRICALRTCSSKRAVSTPAGASGHCAHHRKRQAQLFLMSHPNVATEELVLSHADHNDVHAELERSEVRTPLFSLQPEHAIRYQ